MNFFNSRNTTSKHIFVNIHFQNSLVHIDSTSRNLLSLKFPESESQRLDFVYATHVAPKATGDILKESISLKETMEGSPGDSNKTSKYFQHCFIWERKKKTKQSSRNVFSQNWKMGLIRSDMPPHHILLLTNMYLWKHEPSLRIAFGGGGGLCLLSAKLDTRGNKKPNLNNLYRSLCNLIKWVSNKSLLKTWTNCL